MIQHGELRLPTKPAAALRYSYLPGDAGADSLVVFINGLLLPRSGWHLTVESFVKQQQEKAKTRPGLITYDRFGQGESDADPVGDHDMEEVVRDLYTFIAIVKTRLETKRVSLVLVCNSIGCPIARLFNKAHPALVSAFLFLDSMMANTDFVSIFPDPDAPGFDEEALPQGVTVDGLRKARDVYGRYFHPTVPNKERLDRSNAAQLLPHSDKPALSGLGTLGPLLTVVGHDWDVFALENEKSFALPQALIQQYINPHWHHYNQGLAKLTDEQRCRGPIIAKGCGHFIQRDNPAFVAEELALILERMGSSV